MRRMLAATVVLFATLTVGTARAAVRIDDVRTVVAAPYPSLEVRLHAGRADLDAADFELKISTRAGWIATTGVAADRAGAGRYVVTFAGAGLPWDGEEHTLVVAVEPRPTPWLLMFASLCAVVAAAAVGLRRYGPQAPSRGTRVLEPEVILPKRWPRRWRP
jgi:hypothetical protein